MNEKVVLKCFMITRGEQFVMTASMTRQQELSATLSDLGK